MQNKKRNSALQNSTLRQHLYDLAESLASSWQDSIIKNCQYADSVENKYQLIQEITLQIIDLLGQESINTEKAFAIGQNVTKFNFLHPECLAFTRDAYLSILTENLSNEELLIVFPRFYRIIVEITAGYIASVRESILIEQKQIRSLIEKAKDEAEDARQKIEIRNKAIIDTVPETIIVIDLEGNILYFHRGLINPNPIFPQLVGNNILNIIPENLAATFHSLTEKAHSTGKMQKIVTSLLLQNKNRYFEARLVPYEDDKTLTVVRDVTDLVESENALKLSEARLQEMTRQLISALEYERHQIALELHDQVLSQLGALLLFVDDETIPEQFLDNYHKLIEQIRTTIYGLRPPMLNYGLYPALEDLHAYLSNHIHSNASITFNVSPNEVRFDSNIELHLFRIIQEATTNALKHSQADQILISGNIEANEIWFTIEDNGIGMPYGDTIDLTKALVNNHFGMAGMFERAILIGAKISFTSQPNNGTKVSINWNPNL